MPIDEPIRKTLRKGRVFDLTIESVTLPNGVHIDLEIIRHPGASAIVPLGEDDEVFMLKQYRHAVGGDLWEIPAGTRDAGEAPLECAKRELAEETGYRAARWTPLTDFYSAPGFSTERMYAFLAEELTQGAASPEPYEIIEQQWLSWEDALKAVREGDIRDAKTIATLLYCEAFGI